MKRYFKKKDTITITYRDLKSFDGLKFREEIRNQLEQTENLNVIASVIYSFQFGIVKHLLKRKL